MLSATEKKNGLAKCIIYIKVILIKIQLRWAGHISRMSDSELLKQLFDQLLAKRSIGRPVLLFKKQKPKDNLKYCRAKDLAPVLCLIYTKIWSRLTNIGISWVQILQKFGTKLSLAMITGPAIVALFHALKQVLLSTNGKMQQLNCNHTRKMSQSNVHSV